MDKKEGGKGIVKFEVISVKLEDEPHQNSLPLT